LRTSIGDACGKLRASDALTLAGFSSPSYHRRQVVSKALREMGFERGRYKVNGTMLYAYASGTPLEREAMLVVVKAADGKPIVKRKEK
jgi:hypothetical protein